ncbi:hypothetical protein [Nonomuraea sp. NPDC003804]|uniref:hypothetical protein n=1 Tax=Nonomuraea sp. NPDC003804 TaxID=3154547 RepID=UPI0033AF66F0
MIKRARLRALLDRWRLAFGGPPPLVVGFVMNELDQHAARVVGSTPVRRVWRGAALCGRSVLVFRARKIGWQGWEPNELACAVCFFRAHWVTSGEVPVTGPDDSS